MDACNQLGPIDWRKAGDESEVPGVIITAFIGHRALQRILSDGARFFSGSNYDMLAGTTHYAHMNPKLSQQAFYDMLSPSDAEDLLCLWLFKEHGYVCIPSTNKSSTQLYECVLLDTANGSRVFVQAKKGNSDRAIINVEDYAQLAKEGKVYLLQTTDAYKNEHLALNNPTSGISIVPPKLLYDFARNSENNNYLSPAIKKWIAFLSGSGTLVKG